ncbi:MAG: hypothetical protein ABF296_12665, partial [Oceanococcaceae bacterium]
MIAIHPLSRRRRRSPHLRVTIVMAGLLAGLLPSVTYGASVLEAVDVDAEVSGQLRLHPQTAEPVDRTSSDTSVAFQAELFWESEDRNQRIVVTPFARAAIESSARSHADLRELYWSRIAGDWDIRAGLSRVFWGKTELLHLVDVINQDNNLENLDGEDKLGQPMLRVSRRLAQGELIGFVLPGFRERHFSDVDDRLNPPLPVADSRPLYESSQRSGHVDWALRWQGYAGPLDFGLAHFSGTARDPQFVPDDPQTPTRLRPVYVQQEQTSLDAQLTSGSWLWKIEALYRDTALAVPTATGAAYLSERYAAATGGVEYTLYGVANSAADLGLLAEYLWDERGDRADTLFQNDLFIGGRLALNDVQGTALLAGGVIDLDRGSLFLNLEASRRLDGNTALAVQFRGFSRVDARDTMLFPVRNDDYLEIEL